MAKEFDATFYTEKAIRKMKEVSTDEVYDGKAFRIVWHNSDEEFSDNDFQPYFVEKGKNTPEYQDMFADGEYGMLGVSFFISEKQLKQCKPLIMKMAKKEYCILEGSIDPEKGSTSPPDSDGHFNLFVYKPNNNNNFASNFGKIVDEKRKNNE